MGTCYALRMRVIAKKKLRAFWKRHPKAATPLQIWWTIATQADWTTPQDVKDAFGKTVDFVTDNRVIFDIGGNKYRLIVHCDYRYSIVRIKFVGTHAQYDRINPETVE